MVSEPSLEPLSAALAALGRVALLLDEDFHVVFATPTLDGMVRCEGAHHKIIGKPAANLYGAGLFGDHDPLAVELHERVQREGLRAYLHCEDGTKHLVSMSVGPLDEDARKYLHPRASFVVIMRPADQDQQHLDAAAGALGIVTRSPAMLDVVRLVHNLSRSDATVLITGESGTGKEVVARAIHANSPRAMHEFVAVNCGGVPETLIESELFGHVRGAFTGAIKDRAGRVEVAGRGTLFLDEVAELSPSVQVKLLRMLQEHEYSRVGESSTRSVEARIIAATNIDVETAVQDGRLRRDLYYRLRVVPVHLTPLRDRPEDVEPLTRFLLARIATRAGRALRFAPGVLDALTAHDWPGNVRELENALEYAVAICRGQTIAVEDLPGGFGGAPPTVIAPSPVIAPSKAHPAYADVAAEEPSAEAHRIIQALQHHHWNRAAAAEALGMSRTTLWRRMRTLQLD